MIELSGEERGELTRWSTVTYTSREGRFKGKVILALADGVSYSRIESDLHTSRLMIEGRKRVNAR